MEEFKINFVQLIVICGIIQGVIFTILLPFRKTNFRANCMLALFLFSVSFTLFTSLVLDFGLYDKFPELHWLPMSLTFWLGPSLYFYILFLTKPNYHFKKLDLLHFAPIIFNYFHSIYHLVLGRANPYPLLHNFTEAMETYGILSIIIYFLLILRIVKKYQNSIFDKVSNLEFVTLKWIRELILVVFISLAIVWIFIFIDFRVLIDYRLEYYDTVFFQYDNALKLINVISLYWLGIRGYFQMSIYPFESSKNGLKPEVIPTETEKVQPGNIDLLLQAMKKDKLYLNPTLSLRMLEEKINLPARDISRTLNLGLQKNFYYFVNEYRVEEAKRRLSMPEYDHLSVLGIAFDSGFNSKATFNRIFKEIIGESPSQFRKKIQEGRSGVSGK